MLPYSLPPAETRLSLKVLTKGLLPGNPNFSGKLAALLGKKSCILANSARTLLYLLFQKLRALSQPGRNDVLIPGYTCYSLPAAAVKAGLRVSLYDLEPDTFQPDLDDVQSKLSNRSLAVVGQHLLGVPSSIGVLSRLAADAGAFCIEDAAQLLSTSGIEENRQRAADYSVYSFGRGKPLPLGCGGALVAGNGQNLDGLAEKLQKLPEQNRPRLTPMAVQILSWPALYWLMEKLPLGLGRTVYDPGFQVSGMPLAFQGMGELALDELDRLNRHRSLIAEIYAGRMGQGPTSGFKDRMPHVRYPVLVDNQDQVDKLTVYGLRRMYPQALCDLEALRPHLAAAGLQTPGARKISSKLITLPTHLGVSEDLALKIAGEAKRVFGCISTVRV